MSNVKSLSVEDRKKMGHDGGFCPRCGGDLDIAALSCFGPHLYRPCKACEKERESEDDGA